MPWSFWTSPLKIGNELLMRMQIRQRLGARAWKISLAVQIEKDWIQFCVAVLGCHLGRGWMKFFPTTLLHSASICASKTNTQRVCMVCAVALKDCCCGAQETSFAQRACVLQGARIGFESNTPNMHISISASSPNDQSLEHFLKIMRLQDPEFLVSHF